jgi:hypothetical protein
MPSSLDSLEYAVNLARVRLNDAIQSIGGDIVTDTAAFTLTAINGAWRQLQEVLVNFKYSWFQPETILSALPIVTELDPASQVYVNWSGYFDGTNLQARPVLPPDMIAPLRCWERASVYGANGSFFDMDRLDNGLPAIPKIARNKTWEWRNGALYLPGATQFTDLRLRYAGLAPDFVPSTTTAFSLQLIPIVRSANAFAWFIAGEVAKARGDLDAGDFEQKGQIAAKYLFDLDPTQAKAIGREAESRPVRATGEQ